MVDHLLNFYIIYIRFSNLVLIFFFKLMHLRKSDILIDFRFCTHLLLLIIDPVFIGFCYCYVITVNDTTPLNGYKYHNN